VFTGSVELFGETQIHDFNPGISETEVFWTVPIPEQNVQVSLLHDRARMQLENVDVHDDLTLADSLRNYINGITPDPAVVSFDVQWNMPKKGERIRNEELGYEGFFFTSEQPESVHIAWSGTNKATGFTFTSDPAETSFNVLAVLGFERNGVFF
jgi:hypothetical protein